jgi:hypothetical protein
MDYYYNRMGLVAVLARWNGQFIGCGLRDVPKGEEWESPTVKVTGCHSVAHVALSTTVTIIDPLRVQ